MNTPRVSELDTLLEAARGHVMTAQEREEQTLAFAYGNLAASTNHKPVRQAFKNVALARGMTEERFEEWAKDLEWR